MKKLALAALTMLAVQPSFAASSIECGTGLNKEDGTLKSTAFTISSESDTYLGPAGKTWDMFNAKGDKIKNANLTEEMNGDMTIVVVIDRSAHVGVQYTIKNLPGDGSFTTAERREIGGFAGGSKTGDFDCVITAD